MQPAEFWIASDPHASGSPGSTEQSLSEEVPLLNQRMLQRSMYKLSTGLFLGSNVGQNEILRLFDDSFSGQIVGFAVITPFDDGDWEFPQNYGKSKSNARDYIIRNLTLFTGNHFDILQHTQRRSSQWRKTHTDTRILGMTSLRITTRSFVRRRVRDCTSSSRRKQVRYCVNNLP